jgi:hypothetical protein
MRGVVKQEAPEVGLQLQEEGPDGAARTYSVSSTVPVNGAGRSC